MLNCKKKRLSTPKNVADGHQTPVLYSENELILKAWYPSSFVMVKRTIKG